MTKINRKFIDISGKTFNDLTVLEPAGQDKQGYFIFKCECVCGKICEVRGNGIKSGHNKSCGCRNARSSYKHGMTKTKFYNCWRGILKRSTLKSRKDYNRYGGRGIKICNEWKDFEVFKGDMHESFKEHVKTNGEKFTSLDRIDNNKGYYKSNCRWATPKQQANNRSNNLIVEFNGENKTIAEWANEYGLNYQTLRDRIYKSGWDIKTALTLKPNVRNRPNT